MRKYIKWLVLAAIVGLVVVRLHLVSRPVQMHTVAPGDVVAETMGTGTLEARVKTTISPRIQERLAEVLVDQNDAVKAGQLLARLDDGELKRQAEVAEAAFAGARATAERVRIDESRAEAVEQQARADHQRIADLVRTGVSSASEFDKAVEQLRIAESGLLRARAATAEAQQQVVLSEKTLAYQQERLGFARITSPYDGLITRRDHDPGGVVVPGSSILQLISTNEIWVSAWVDETAAAGLAAGQTARVVFRSDPGQDYRGEVARLGRETDRETREFLVEVRVAELPPNWTVGQRAEVFVQRGLRTGVIAVPQRFLQWQNGKPGVFIAKGSKATWRDVTLGLRGREMVEVTHGLSAGDRVIAIAEANEPPLKSGQRVTGK